MAEPTPQLDYQIPGSTERHHSPWLALALCAPGAACFVLFFGNGVIVWDLPPSIAELLGNLFWPIWFTAVAAAIVSVCLYARLLFKPLPWYVTLNLTINISGLLFSAAALVAVM